jgi:hypothetical protein
VYGHDPEVTVQRLGHSAEVARDAFRGWVEAGRSHIGVCEHPVVLFQHLLWHEVYHTGRMELALKVAGLPMADAEAGPITWDVWRRQD